MSVPAGSIPQPQIAGGETPVKVTSRKPRGQYRNGIRQRERILDSATEIFARHGYAGGSLRQIAAQVSVTPGNILLHFGSKEALLMAVLDRWTSSSFEAREPSQGLDNIRGLTGLMNQHLSERKLIELFTTMASEATDPQHPAHDLMVARYEDVVARIAADLTYAGEHGQIRPLDEQEVGVYARRVVAMMDGLQIQWLLNSSLDLVAEFDDFIDSLIQRLS